LLGNTTALADAVSPGFTPLARWPSPGRYPLVLLQQVAVNLALRETESGGLLGVNGPPGTGKTTLLRDLVAGVATARAEAMAKFEDPETGHVERRIPHIVEAEQPPSTHEEALERWKSTRKRFRRALDKSRQSQTWSESLRTDLARLPALAQAEADAKAKRDAATENARRLQAALATARRTEAETSRQLQHADQELHTHDLAKPGFWARLFRTRASREWSDKLKVLRANHRGMVTQHTKKTAERRHIEDEVRRGLLEQQNTETAWQAACAQHQQAKQRLTEAQQEYGVVLVDATFFALEHAKRHQSTPWFPPAAQRLRDEVFISAMAVHRAFIDAAAKPLRHNLGALMNAFTTQTLPGAEKQVLLPDLWASLFLVVPLVSTTFASVNRMLGKLPPENLGWLFVDEAGQALPQAAVGALLRTRRAVVVGDPVQIEPVVLLPDTLTNAICRHFGVDPER